MAINGEPQHVQQDPQADRLTIRDVARLAGVSIATVSRVANGRPDVSEQTRTQVMKVMQTHGFTANRSSAHSRPVVAITGEPRHVRQDQQAGRLTIRDIARMAGVSIATVSRVANGRPDVSEQTRTQVTKVMHTHGFTANRSARALSARRTGLIGFTVPFVEENYFTGILSGAAEALYELGQRIVLCPTHHDHDREVTLLEHLMGGTTDGALILLPEESSPELRRLQEQGYPFVVADPRQPLDDGIPAVSAAHAAGARAATDHLLRLGHRRVGLITGTPGWVATEERIEGYRIALATGGLPFTYELLAGGDFTTETGYRAAQLLLELTDPPTAIFASNDNLAIGAMRAAFERGLSIPGDISIVGFDDIWLANNLFPRLTTVRQPLAELGRTAVSLLNRLVNGQRIEALRIELATQLIVRESTGPAPS
jgi:LacI family transcriptional regulator